MESLRTFHMNYLDEHLQLNFPRTYFFRSTRSSMDEVFQRNSVYEMLPVLLLGQPRDRSAGIQTLRLPQVYVVIVPLHLSVCVRTRSTLKSIASSPLGNRSGFFSGCAFGRFRSDVKSTKKSICILRTACVCHLHLSVCLSEIAIYPLSLGYLRSFIFRRLVKRALSSRRVASRFTSTFQTNPFANSFHYPRVQQ